jgi:hypothetical protein
MLDIPKPMMIEKEKEEYTEEGASKRHPKDNPKA